MRDRNEWFKEAKGALRHLWKKLLEDLDEGANHSEYSPCFYFRKDMCDCSSCEADRYSNCDQPAFKDIASRIRKLRGEGDAD